MRESNGALHDGIEPRRRWEASVRIVCLITTLCWETHGVVKIERDDNVAGSVPAGMCGPFMVVVYDQVTD